MNSGSEQAPERKYLRVSADFPATVILPGHELILLGKAVDLSGGGMRVVTATDLPSGQTIVLRFSLPGLERELLVRGRIVLSFYDAAAKQYAHGVAFTQYAPQDQEAIASFISKAKEAPI
ncbi:MAG: PilZ domain-containing protein [Candidatus Eremiobacteraeota bacterium]|nr:PilZ domain-containing protein [Candidatus Eremiobacteraeota bacterium]MBV8332291.1 PilZ domain-containing protein [Candidatus Eremiobacteraeota bacterium]MBV8434400.1 PilZ domain-containing protein [Candidatus Eremiobacteraeota bacterium]MBV8722661.1 PilZ domain-containing protein [Candidatus Eremiobacteraeota bacterium]